MSASPHRLQSAAGLSVELTGETLIVDGGYSLGA